MGYLVSLRPIWSTVGPCVKFFFHLSLKSYIHLKYTSKTIYLLIVKRLVNIYWLSILMATQTSLLIINVVIQCCGTIRSISKAIIPRP